jgi:hypothetical protein
MNEYSPRISFDGNRRVYRPGDMLRGEYELHSLKLSQPAAVEISVLWHTEGQGDEDLAVHHFERLSAEEGRDVASLRSGRFETRLPASPLSYQGLIVKIRWCVRVRVFLARGKELLAEMPFQLGTVPPARAARQPVAQDE